MNDMKHMRYGNFVKKMLKQRDIEVQQGESINTFYVTEDSIHEIIDKRVQGFGLDYLEVVCLWVNCIIKDPYLNLKLGKAIFIADGDAFECKITQLSHIWPPNRLKEEIIFTSDLIRYKGKVAIRETVTRIDLLDL